jgi:hypothetical protein
MVEKSVGHFEYACKPNEEGTPVIIKRVEEHSLTMMLQAFFNVHICTIETK